MGPNALDMTDKTIEELTADLEAAEAAHDDAAYEAYTASVAEDEAKAKLYDARAAYYKALDAQEENSND